VVGLDGRVGWGEPSAARFDRAWILPLAAGFLGRPGGTRSDPTPRASNLAGHLWCRVGDDDDDRSSRTYGYGRVPWVGSCYHGLLCSVRELVRARAGIVFASLLPRNGGTSVAILDARPASGQRREYDRAGGFLIDCIRIACRPPVISFGFETDECAVG